MSKIYAPIEKYLIKLHKKYEYLDYGRDIIIKWVGNYMNANRPDTYKVLDIGAGSGIDLDNIRRNFHNISLCAIESYQPNVDKLRDLGVAAYCINIEQERLPFNDCSFDIIVANHIIEHTKEVFFIFSEISRVLKKGGIAIIGFPNLAAWYNRILMLFGAQPVCMRMPGPHVRGITKGGFYQFITTNNYFEVEQVTGANFYPFPPPITHWLATIFPTLAISLYFLCRRTDNPENFIDILKTRFYETNYLEEARSGKC